MKFHFCSIFLRSLAGVMTSALCLFPIAAPHRVLLVVDTNYQESVTVGNHYRLQRGIPETNIVRVGLRDSDRYNNYYSSSTFGNFSNDLLAPIQHAIAQRGLASTIDYIVLSYGIPVRLRHPSGSVDISTTSYLATYENFSNATSGWAGSPPFASATNQPFSCTNSYPGGKHFRLASHLFGYRSDEVMGAVDRAVASDGTFDAANPKGKWVLQVGPYGVLGSNDAWPLAQEWSNLRGLDALWTNSGFNFKSANITNMIALLHGGSYSGYNYFNTTNYYPRIMALPGAYVEAHESFGLLSDHFFESRSQQQYPMPLYLRHGFTTMSGAVIEPFLGFMQASSDTNRAERFRRMFMAGHTALESAYFASWRDERGPTTFVGDPLSRPFARVPVVTFSTLADGDSVSGSLSIGATASVSGANGVGGMELYLDDNPDPIFTSTGNSLNYSWDSTTCPDGVHQIYVVAYENHALRHAGWKRIKVISQNQGRSIVISSPASGTTHSVGDMAVTVTAGGPFDQVRLKFGPKVVATSNLAGNLTISKTNLIWGQNQALTAELLSGGQVVCSSTPILVHCVPSLRLLSFGGPNSGTNLSMSNFFTNLDYQFQSGVIRLRATNVTPGASLWVDGVLATPVSFDFLSGDSDVADLSFAIPTLSSPGGKTIILSNAGGLTTYTNANFYAPVASSVRFSPQTLIVAPGEKLKLSAFILDQYSNTISVTNPVVWNSVAGGSAAGSVFTAGTSKGDYSCDVTVGAFVTNILVGVHGGRTNYFDSFDQTNHWSPTSTSSLWTAGSNEIRANGAAAESFVYLNRNFAHRTNFTGVIQFEGMLVNNTSGGAFFGVRALGEAFPDAKNPWRRGYGYGVGVYPNEVRTHNQNFTSTSGGFVSSSGNFATNVWYTVRLAYDSKSVMVAVYSNGQKQFDTNLYYQNGPVYTNVVRLAGAYGSRFRNFKIMDPDASDLSPNPPTSFRHTHSTSSQVDLAWADLSDNETGFQIYRSFNNSNYTLFTNVPANSTGCTLSSLDADTSYSFRLTAVSGSGESLFDGPVFVKTKAALVPEAPANPSGAISLHTVTLFWTDLSTNESGFRIERSTDGILYSNWASAAPQTNSIALGGLPSGSSFFRICATNSAGDSPYAGPIYIVHEAPQAPGNFSATASGISSMALTWDDTSTNETGYVIYRNWAAVATNGSNETLFSDSGLSTNVTYYYYVASVNAFQEVASSWLARKIIPAPPLGPSNLSANTLSATNILLTWNDAASNTGGFIAERTMDYVTWAEMARLPAGTCQLEVFGMIPGISNGFRVMATNVFGNSAPGPAISVQTERHLQLGNIIAAANPSKNCLLLVCPWSGKNFSEDAELEISVATSGGEDWVPLPMENRTLRDPSGIFSNGWIPTPGFDTRRQVDVRFRALYGDSVLSGGVLATNIDLTKMFFAQGNLDRVAAVNNPWRGESDAITFVNLTPRAEITIRSPSGKAVSRLRQEPRAPGFIKWVLLGKEEGSTPGIYTAVVEDPSFGQKVLRVVVLPRP